MATRNESQRMRNPDLALGEWVDSRIYSDHDIFEEEMEKIFRKVWIPACHGVRIAESL